MGPEDLVRKFNSKFPEIEANVQDSTHVEFTVPKGKIRDLVNLVDETFPMVLPETVFGVDLGDDKYQINYMFWSRDSRLITQLRVNLDGPTPSVDSVSDIFPAFEWHERETHEMFGIMFNGHPDLRPLLLPDELVGQYPLRKSFQTDRSREDESGLVVKKPRPDAGGGSE
ncbi:MAG: NADH-quinone oxidoreductase subunit C [Candidatus Thorarchaeota archaeon]